MNEPNFEFPFTQEDFDGLRHIVTTHTGIQLPDSKKSLMYSRLVRRLRHHGMANFNEYHRFVKSDIDAGNEEEMMAIVNAMTTNVTHFFREHHHFDHLAKILPELCEQHPCVEIWSAASSIGAEPWSIAMVAAHHKRANPSHKISIHASDIDSNVLNIAKTAVYELQDSEVQNHKLLKKYLKPSAQGLSVSGKSHGHNCYEVVPDIKRDIQFHQINLLHPLPQVIPKRCHIIFCRNVIIYFDRQTKIDLFKKFAARQQTGDYICIGHSESLLGICDDYEPIGHTIYRRK